MIKYTKKHKKTIKNIKRKKTSKHKITKKNNFDYNSSNGMLTKVWGPTMWHYLHIMSFNYPLQPSKHDKKNYKQFILLLSNILPCKYCRINLKKNLKTLPLTQNYLKNRGSFSLYVYKLHELINNMLNKKSKLTYNDVRERYEHFRANCFKNTQPKIESGCTEPLNGEKSKCIIKIVPQNEKYNDSIQIDKRCIIK
jgi:hypothetical protein